MAYCVAMLSLQFGVFNSHDRCSQRRRRRVPCARLVLRVIKAPALHTYICMTLHECTQPRERFHHRCLLKKNL